MSDLLELVNECGEAAQERGNVEAAIVEANELKDLGFNAMAAEIMARATRKAKLNRIADLKYVVITDEKVMAFLKRKAGVVKAPIQDRFDTFIKNFTMTEKSERDIMGRWSKTGPVDYSASVGIQSLHSAMLASFAGAQNQLFDARLAGQQRDLSLNRGFGSPSAQMRAYDAKGDAWVWMETAVENYQAIPPKDVLVKMAEHKARGCFDSFTIASVEKIKDPLLLGRIDGVTDRRWYVAQWGQDIALDDVI